MRSVVLLATLLALPSSGLAEPRGAPPLGPGGVAATGIDCLNSHVRHAGPAAAQRPRRQILAELPPGNLHLAVVREVAGCQEPVIVRHDVGPLRR